MGISSPFAVAQGPISVSSAVVALTLDTSDRNSVTIQVTNAGTSCTIVYEGSLDGTNWLALAGYNMASTTAAGLTATTGTGMYVFDTSGIQKFRVRVSAYTSGTITFIAVTDVCIPQVRALNATLNTTATVVATATTSSNGAALHRRISSADTNLVSLKGTAGKIHGGSVSNLTAAFKFLKLYNKASAPVLASDVPVITIPIPPNFTVGVHDFVGLLGYYFSTGIAYAITGALADTDTTPLVAGDVVLNLNWI